MKYDTDGWEYWGFYEYCDYGAFDVKPKRLKERFKDRKDNTGFELCEQRWEWTREEYLRNKARWEKAVRLIKIYPKIKIRIRELKKTWLNQKIHILRFPNISFAYFNCAQKEHYAINSYCWMALWAERYSKALISIERCLEHERKVMIKTIESV